jgi:hypothetical protein
MLRFEDLISDPTKHVPEICDFLGIPFTEQMLEEITVVGSGYLAQRRGPTGFDQEAIERWRQHLNPLTKAWFSIVARQHLKKFGYEL